MPVDTKIALAQWERFRFCVERGHYEFVAKADKCDKFFVGEQWDTRDMDTLKQQKRPALTINKIISTIGTILGEQIYNRNEVLFRPSTGASANTADALTKVWMQIAQSNQLPWVRSDVFADGVIRSRGFYDVRLDFDNSMQGIIKIEHENSKNIVIDPDAEQYDPDTWNDVFKTKWLTPDDIELLYNKDDADYLRTNNSSVFPYAYDSIERVRDRFSGTSMQGTYYGTQAVTNLQRNIRVIERQYRKLAKQEMFVDTKTGDTTPVPEGWDRNRIAQVLEKSGNSVNVIKKLTKRIRWTVTADAVVLHDDWSPYKHFTVVPYFPYLRHGRTVGIVENLIDPQELLNKVSSQELHVINTTANSGWKVKAGTLVNMSIEELEQSGSQSGLVLELQDVNDAEKILPNQTPNGLDRISSKAEEHIKSISNVSDSMQGFDRSDVAAKAIDYKTQRGSINMTKVLDNLERTDFILARNVLAIVQEYMTEERLVHITHSDVMKEPETVTVNQEDPETGEILNDLTLGEYDIVITSQPAKASMEDSQFEQALELRKEGVEVPDSILIENSRMMRRADIIKMMDAAKNSPEAQAAAALKVRQNTAMVEKLEAEVEDKKADSQLKSARAQKEASQVEDPQNIENSPEMIKMRAEHELDTQRQNQEMSFKEREFQQKMAFQREAHDEDMRMKREQAELAAEQSRTKERQERLTSLSAEQTEETT
jgi:hypothetical protein